MRRPSSSVIPRCVSSTSRHIAATAFIEDDGIPTIPRGICTEAWGHGEAFGTMQSRLYFRPFVLGRGRPYFAVARPRLRLVSTGRTPLGRRMRLPDHAKVNTRKI
jgi:hypothetical protein